MGARESKGVEVDMGDWGRWLCAEAQWSDQAVTPGIYFGWCQPLGCQQLEPEVSVLS